MSIKVRMAIQPILDEAGLSLIHADVRSDGGFPRERGYLQLVGECGKPYVTLYGIRFSSTNPSNGEVKYVADLVGEFVSKHKEKLREMLSLATEKRETYLKLEKAKEKIKDHQAVKVLIIENLGPKFGMCVSVRLLNGATFSHRFDTAETFLSSVDAKVFLHKNEVEEGFSIMDDLFHALFEVVDAHEKYMNVSDNLNVLINVLGSCDI